jgi:hypothetical protein
MRAANQQPKVESTKAQLAREAREYRKLNPPHENRTLGDVLHRLPQDLGLEGLKKPQGPISVHPPTPGEVLDQALLAVPAEGIAAKAGRLLLRARRGERTAAEAGAELSGRARRREEVGRDTLLGKGKISTAVRESKVVKRSPVGKRAARREASVAVSRAKAEAQHKSFERVRGRHGRGGVFQEAHAIRGARKGGKKFSQHVPTFLAEGRFSLNPEKGIPQLRAERERLIRAKAPRAKKGRAPTDLDVVEYILDHPEVLSNKHTHEAIAKYGKAVPRESRFTSETRRTAPVARQYDQLLPDEMIPHAARDITRSSGEKGVHAERTLRDEAAQDRRSAKAHRSKAGRLVAKRAEANKAGRKQRVANLNTEVAALRKKADRLEEHADIKTAAIRDVGGEAVQNEYRANIQALRKQHDLPESHYVHHADVGRQEIGSLHQSFTRNPPPR